MEARCPDCGRPQYNCPVCSAEADGNGLQYHLTPLICENASHPTHTCQGVASQSAPSPIERGAANDEKARADSVLNGMAVKNVENCPTDCPSCGVTSALSKLDVVMSRLGTEDLPPHPSDFEKEDRKFGGSDAHAIVSQALLRDHTRSALTEFLDANEKKLGSRSPCVFQSDEAWEDFEKTYISGMVEEASRPGNDEAITKQLADKDKKERRTKAALSNTLERLRQWQAVWDDRGQTAPQKKDEPARPAKTTRPPIYTPPELEHQLAEAEKIAKEKKDAPPGLERETAEAQKMAKQKESLDKFIARDLTQYATSFTVERLANGHIEFRMSTPLLTSEMTLREGHELEKRKVCDVNGKTIKYEEKVIVFGEPQDPKSLMVASDRVAKDEWVLGMFSGIMGSPFTKGTQCRYCEELQGNESVIQRYAYWKKHPGSTPDEYVGKGLIEEIETQNGGDARAYVTGWMQGVAAELRKRILQECKLEQAKKKPPDSGPKDTKQGEAEVANAYSENEMEEAIEDALELLRAGNKSFTRNKLIADARGTLNTDKSRPIDNHALAKLVETKLMKMAGDGMLTCPKANQYSFPKA